MSEKTLDIMQSDIFQVDKALESWRDSGFDLSTAIGELVDNSIEARCQIIKIEPYQHKKTKSIETIAFADNGMGIDPEILAQTLKIGFSTRYNQRKGLGRFGVGMKAAALSQGRRIDIYTKPVGNDNYYHAYLDLDEVAKGEQTHIVAKEVDGFPVEYENHMAWDKETPFESGTLIIWSKIDRLENEGKYGNSVSEAMQDLTKFLARAFRVYIDQGLSIQLAGKTIDLYDPLFLLESPRVNKILGGDHIPAQVIDRTEIPIGDENVILTVTLLPKELRRVSGEGGYLRSASRYKELYLRDNDGCITIMRNGREIYFDVIPRLLPGRVENIDRFIGIEISFPATLDEYFQVRNVKRGAVPVGKLRKAIKDSLDKPVRAARKEIKRLFSETNTNTRKNDIEHTIANKAVTEVEKTSIPGRAGMGASKEQEQMTILEILQDIGVNESADQDLANNMRNQIEQQAITLVDSSWPGKELFDITHLNGRAVVKINQRHPFISEIYNPIKEISKGNNTDLDSTEIQELAVKVEGAIDILFMAYAKAENMHMHPDDVYSDLRSYWSQFSSSYVREMLRSF